MIYNKKNPEPGKIIALEGCDGCGKDTQLNILYDRLTKEGYKCIKLSFPNYDNHTGKIIGKLLSKSNPNNLTTMDFTTQAMYFMANRRETFNTFPDLKLNYDFILMGRSILSNFAYQTNIPYTDNGFKANLLNEIENLVNLEMAFGNPIYDYAIVYDIDLETAKNNLINTKRSYLENGDEDVHESDYKKLEYVIRVYREIVTTFDNVVAISVSDNGNMFSLDNIAMLTYSTIKLLSQ